MRLMDEPGRRPDNPLAGVLRRVVDNAVYLPIGAAALLQEQLPSLVERGRNQVAMAKMIGQFASQQARTELDRRVSALFAGGEPATPQAPTLPPEPAAATTVAAAAEPKPAKRRAVARTSTTSGAALAIDGYDSLPATNVLALLDGLSRKELADVAAFESQHRARRTILHRIDSLLAQS